jgi:two-component system NtrC family sensor kinase
MVIPSPQTDPAPLDTFSSQEDAGSPLRILLVEDNLETAEMVRHLLEYEGYQVVEINSGVAAMQRIASVDRGEAPPFDVALLDVMLPFVNGFEVCQEIRRTERLGYIPIIMVTALRGTDDMIRGLDLGADDYLVKPFNPRELLARVRAALRFRDIERAMRRRNWQLALLNALSDAIGGSLDRDEVLRAALSQLLQRMNFGYAVAFVHSREPGAITRVLYHDGETWSEEHIDSDGEGASAAAPERWQGRSAYQLALDVVTSGQRRWQTDAQDWPIGPDEQGTRRDWRAAVPLSTKPPYNTTSGAPAGSDGPGDAGATPSASQVLGVLMVGAPADEPMIDLNLLTAIGNQIGQTLEKCRFYQQARDRSEELAALFDSISDLIYVVDERYRISAVNKGLLEWLEKRHAGAVQKSVASPLGQTCYQFLYGEERPCAGCAMTRALQSREHIQWTEHRRQPDRSREEWELSAYPIQGGREGSAQAIILARDITERRMLEDSLSQSEKLAALGQLAAGLAHEINNPLTAIVANIQLLMMTTESSDSRFESLALIRQASDRAVKVVGNLLNFARQEQYEFRPTDLSASLHSALELVRHQYLIAQVKVHRDLTPDLPLALVSQDHLQGVWLNLLLNARDALTARAADKKERCVWVSTRQRDENLLEVTVRDNGIGIAPDQLNRIFEPFFTTKDPGKGTGLGLSTSFQVIKQHGGEILVDSEPGGGTTFSVLLPAMRSAEP